MANKLTYQRKRFMLELYKAHYSREEVVRILGIRYFTVAHYYRAWELADIPKYDRYELIGLHTEIEGFKYEKAGNY